MVGECPSCNTKILDFKNGVRPLGNYRTLEITFSTNQRMRFPLCVNCYDADIEDKLPAIIYVYMKENSTSEKMTRQQMHDYHDSFKNLNIVSIKKLGTLKAEDTQNMRIWL